MKHIILLISFVSLFMSASSFASVDSTDQLKERISVMIAELEKRDSSVAVKRMIVKGAVKALSESNIKDEELTERINSAVYSISASFSKKERAVLNTHLAKLK